MSKKNISKDLREAFRAASPDVFDQILFRAENGEGYMIMEQKKKRSGPAAWKAAVLVAAALLLTAGAVCAVVLHKANKPPVGTAPDSAQTAAKSETAIAGTTETTPQDVGSETVVRPPILEKYYVGIVRTDVNAEKDEEGAYLGVRIYINTHKKTLVIAAYKDDEKKLLNTVSYEQEGLTKALTNLLVAVAGQGYLSDDRNLISIPCDPETFGQVKEALTAAVEALAEKGYISDRERLTGKADPQQMLYLKKTRGVSLGHAKYALLLAEKDPSYTLNELLDMSVARVKDLCVKKGIDTTHVRTTPAKMLAQTLAELGIREADAEVDEASINSAENMEVIELRFKANGAYYFYLYDAQSAMRIHAQSFKIPTDKEAIAYAEKTLLTDAKVEVTKTWINFSLVGSFTAKRLSCTVTLRYSDGLERWVLFNAENYDFLNKGERKTTVKEEELEEIVAKDLGVALKNGVGISHHYTSPHIFLVYTEVDQTKYAYIIHVNTGEILYKEMIGDRKSVGYFTESYAVKVAEITAQLAGGQKIEILECQKLQKELTNSSVDVWSVRLTVDGREHTCTVSIYGGVNYE